MLLAEEPKWLFGTLFLPSSPFYFSEKSVCYPERMFTKYIRNVFFKNFQEKSSIARVLFFVRNHGRKEHKNAIFRHFPDEPRLPFFVARTKIKDGN